METQLAKTPELSKLVVDLSQYGPDDAFSLVPYNKGSIFLRYIEQQIGGPAVFEPFFRWYLKKFAQKSIVSDDFKAAIFEFFAANHKHTIALKRIDWDVWFHQPGMPPVLPK